MKASYGSAQAWRSGLEASSSSTRDVNPDRASLSASPVPAPKIRSFAAVVVADPQLAKFPLPAPAAVPSTRLPVLAPLYSSARTSTKFAAKSGGQGEREPAKHAPDAGPRSRVPDGGARTSSTKGKEEGRAHCAAPRHQHRSAPPIVLCTET